MSLLNKIKEATRELNELEEREEEIREILFELKREIKNKKRLMQNKERSESWRKRTKKLIEYGALMEIAGLLDEDKESGLMKFDKSTLLGYLLKFRLLSETEISDCKLTGLMEFRKRESTKGGKL